MMRHKLLYSQEPPPKVFGAIFYIKLKEVITMKTIILNKLDKPEFGELFQMIGDLKDFLNEDVDFENKEWKDSFNAILDFQDAEGSFKLLAFDKLPSDAKVDFHYIPTYLCTAILMKAYMTDVSTFSSKEKFALLGGLKASCPKSLRGHGFEALKGQIEALNMFMKAELKEFIDLHPDFCSEFTDMIEGIVSSYQGAEVKGKFLGPWGESYQSEIKAINEYFCQRLVFVYGTLMSGEGNHRYLENSTFLGRTAIEGYDMHDVGWYPAIVPGDGLVVGELYSVPIDDMPSIDMLEGEGSLYAKRCETVTYGGRKTAFAFVYVYMRDVSGLERIPAWGKDYVWYVSYGSNMLKDRFMKYIKGGSYGSSKPRDPCKDTAPPVAVKAVRMPFDMYFAEDSSWGGGVSFLDMSKEGHALGVAYLITEEQFRHVAKQENGGRFPDGKRGWYKDCIELGKMNGFEMITVTNYILRDYNDPTDEYQDVLHSGIRENFPDMSDEDIRDYLDGCIR